MEDRKFTDDEVIKALECCVEGTSEACLKCVFGLTPPYPVCKTMIEKHALALINRQKAEIERLRYNLEAVLEERADHTEAIKEFAERLKSHAPGDLVVICFEAIDDIVKEMTEGGDPRKDAGK